jgi:hypothetical protein
MRWALNCRARARAAAPSRDRSAGSPISRSSVACRAAGRSAARRRPPAPGLAQAGDVAQHQRAARQRGFQHRQAERLVARRQGVDGRGRQVRGERRPATARRAASHGAAARRGRPGARRSRPRAPATAGRRRPRPAWPGSWPRPRSGRPRTPPAACARAEQRRAAAVGQHAAGEAHAVVAGSVSSIACVGAATRPAPASPADDTSAVGVPCGGASQPCTACHHDSTQECATSSVGARNGSAPNENWFRCTTSGCTSGAPGRAARRRPGRRRRRRRASIRASSRTRAA